MPSSSVPDRWLASEVPDDGKAAMRHLHFQAKSGWEYPHSLVQHLFGALKNDMANKIVARVRDSLLVQIETPIFEMEQKKVLSDLWRLVHV
jgi:hypothetical protein